jgi:hypothetical protein
MFAAFGMFIEIGAHQYGCSTLGRWPIGLFSTRKSGHVDLRVTRGVIDGVHRVCRVTGYGSPCDWER